MPEPALPRLLYIADVPVESSQHGSALLFRALETYPADRLLIVETGPASQPARRLPGVTYQHLAIADRRLLNSRLHGWYSAWLSMRSRVAPPSLLRLAEEFRPEAVLTVGHGFGWITASAVAAASSCPLHLIVHDDWPRLSAIAGVCRGWLDRGFGRIYRSAASRLCISPFMAEEYERRYGASAEVMLPSRSTNCPVFGARATRRIDNDDLVVGYGGNSGPDMMACLRQLAAAIASCRARLVVYGPFNADAQRELYAITSKIAFEGFVPFPQMIEGLRSSADVLFVPMTFEESSRDNMRVSFPSKLADYTACGLPLLIYGPPYSSAVWWANAYGDAALVVAQEGAGPLAHALDRLRLDDELRSQLARRAVDAGHACFDPEAVRHLFANALMRTGQ